MSRQPRQAYVVSHTHWDREWYQTFSRFRVDLLDVVDQVLNALESSSRMDHFVLDGQTAVLEDYLEARPEQRDRVEGLIASGKLAVGPWYILPDEFLVSGEATVRNLLVGRAASPGGRIQSAGYMPDSFGHIAQIPQILRLAGIDSFIFTRGLGNEGPELGWLFRWLGPDGSEVLAVNQCLGYCNAGGLGFEEIWHAHTQREVVVDQAVLRIGELLAAMQGRPGSDPALINNGCDHFPPQQDYDGVVGALESAFPDTDFRPGSFVDFLNAARADCPDADRPGHAGELLGGRDHLILSGVWSTRMPLKQKNEVCQNLLARIVEPLAAAEYYHRERPWPGGLLQTAWKELLRNHPHDSICGCSTDEVHREMETRFASVQQTGEQMLSRQLNRLTPMFAARSEGDHSVVICVANPLPFERDEVMDRIVVLQPMDYDLDRLHLEDEQGRPVPFEIVGKRFLERFWGVDYRAQLNFDDQFALLDTYLRRFGNRIIGTERDRDIMDCFLHIRFLARDLPAVGHALFTLTDEETGSASAEYPPAVLAAQDPDFVSLENEFLSVRLYPDGIFDLKDLNTGRRFEGLNLLEDAEDIGDEYDYCSAANNALNFSAGSAGKVKVAERSALLARAVATFRFDLPRSLEPDRRSRNPRTTPCDVEVRLTLRAGARRLEVETTFNNRAFDHRLRAWFSTGLEASEVVSDGHFMLNRRPLKRPTAETWEQPAPPTWPQQDFSAIADDAGNGLAIFNRGLPETETLDDGQGGTVFALTLLRCVDWLSRDDFPTRKNTNAGPTLFTPDAQCIGRHTFRYAVMPFEGDLFTADIKGQSERYRAEPISHQGVIDGSVPGGTFLVRKSEPRVAITAIKRAERDGRLILRLYNQDTTPVTEILELGMSAIAAEKTDLYEDDLQVDRQSVKLDPEGRQLHIPLEGCEIATVAIRLEHLISERKEPS